MSLDTAVARVAELSALAQRSIAPAPTPAASATGASFASVLSSASAGYPAVTAASFGGSGAGARVIAAAEGEVGQAEQPPGSNDGPRIAVYRSAVAGSSPGQMWCAYFASWAAAQAGVPLGDHGQGLGSVDQIRSWASSTGRLISGDTVPQPGDLILFGSDHVGIVEGVAADGTITTVEGNSGDAVSRRTRAPGEATDFVRLG